MRQVSHRIRSQRWLVRTDSPEDAFAWRGFLSDNVQDLLLPVLEKAFDEASPGEEAIHVPRIELTLKLPSDQQAFEALPDLIYRQFRWQLGSDLQKSVSLTGELHRQIRDKAATRLDILFQYLKTGVVPWHAAGTSASDTAIDLAEALRAEWPQVLDHARNNRENPSFYFRLLNLISEEKRRDMILLLAERLPERLQAATSQFLMHLFGSAGKGFSGPTRLHLASETVAMLQERKNMRDQCLFPLLEKAVPPKERVSVYDFISGLPWPARALFLGNGEEGPIAHEAAADEVQDDQKMRESPDSIQTEAGEFAIAVDNADLCQKERQGSGIPQVEGIVPAPRYHDRPGEDRYPLLVHQAGLALLHPYIIRFFENTGITRGEKRQIPSFALARAAALLHILATGRADVYEFELGLIKVLLGLRPEIPLLICEGFLETGDRAEAEALLVSVITHWRALKNTSPAGLRASFLERPALLREKEKSWNLKVERRPYDILLEQLPWSIAFVKLPWMKQSISIEW